MALQKAEEAKHMFVLRGIGRLLGWMLRMLGELLMLMLRPIAQAIGEALGRLLRTLLPIAMGLGGIYVLARYQPGLLDMLMQLALVALVLWIGWRTATKGFRSSKKKS